MTQLGLVLEMQRAQRREPTPGTHNALILGALLAGDRLTPKDANIRFGCARLAARIHDLIHKYHWYNIKSHMIKVAKQTQVAEYWMERN